MVAGAVDHRDTLLTEPERASGMMLVCISRAAERGATRSRFVVRLYYAAMPLAAGQTFADYTIVRLLGSGGMGDVYLAEHPRLPRRDALKVLRNDVCADNEYRRRFDREADLAATLWHPHIVGVHDRGDVDGQIWISMDYVDGTDAAELLRDRYPNGMPKEDVLNIITGVAEALDYAHQQGLLHRDVKPANIMLSDPTEGEQRVLLGDFGIARRVDDANNLTATNMTVGTVFYAAPEQLMGEDLDGRADQYALAATAFHLLSGSPPFHHSNPTVVISQHLTASPPAISDRRPSCRRSIRFWARPFRRTRRIGSSAAWTSRGRWHTGSGWSRRPTTSAPKHRCPSPPDLGAGANTKPSNRRAGNTCDPHTSCLRSWPRCCWSRSPSC